jgi:glycosyltransferase involved in cell wall biosynthesis
LIRVLHIISDTNIGGAGRHLLNFLKYYDRSQLEVMVLCPVGSLLVPRCRELGVEITEVPEMPADELLSLGALRRQLPAFTGYIKKEKIQLVHTHASFAGRLAARLTGVRCVYTKHCIDPLSEKRSPKDRVAQLANNLTCDRAIGVSRAVGDNLIAEGIRPDKVAVIYNGIDLELYRPGAAAARQWPAPVVSIVARISAEKGHAYFLEAAQQVLKEHPDVTFLVVGTGPLEGKMRDYAQSLGIGGHVVFTGLRNDIPYIMEQTDVLTVPSLSEAQSLSLVEGMCMGKACVGSAVGGIPEVITDGVDGLLALPGNSADLAAKICILLDDPQLAARLGQVAAISAGQRFGARGMASRITALYLEICPQKSV